MYIELSYRAAKKKQLLLKCRHRRPHSSRVVASYEYKCIYNPHLNGIRRNRRESTLAALTTMVLVRKLLNAKMRMVCGYELRGDVWNNVIKKCGNPTSKPQKGEKCYHGSNSSIQIIFKSGACCGSSGALSPYLGVDKE